MELFIKFWVRPRKQPPEIVALATFPVGEFEQFPDLPCFVTEKMVNSAPVNSAGHRRYLPCSSGSQAGLWVWHSIAIRDFAF